ncbi:MAG: hypothetical protein ACM3PP_11425 [Candidatus Saccharibacteria bacterium]
MEWHRYALVLAIFIMTFLTGCSGIREIETNSSAKQSQQAVYISEDQARQTVCKLVEQSSIDGQYVLITERFPSQNRPQFVIRAAKDDGDHLHSMQIFTIDAINARVVSVKE